MRMTSLGQSVRKCFQKTKLCATSSRLTPPSLNLLIWWRLSIHKTFAFRKGIKTGTPKKMLDTSNFHVFCSVISTNYHGRPPNFSDAVKEKLCQNTGIIIRRTSLKPHDSTAKPIHEYKIQRVLVCCNPHYVPQVVRSLSSTLPLPLP